MRLRAGVIASGAKLLGCDADRVHVDVARARSCLARKGILSVQARKSRACFSPGPASNRSIRAGQLFVAGGFAASVLPVCAKPSSEAVNGSFGTLHRMK